MPDGFFLLTSLTSDDQRKYWAKKARLMPQTRTRAEGNIEHPSRHLLIRLSNNTDLRSNLRGISICVLRTSVYTVFLMLRKSAFFSLVMLTLP